MYEYLTVQLAATASLFIAIIALAILIVGILTYRRTNAITSKEIISELLRFETDSIKSAGNERDSNLRQEITNSVQVAFKTLNDFVNIQITGFGQRLESGVTKIDQRVDSIGNKLNDDLLKLGIEAAQNRDALRQVVESKLDESITKQSALSSDFSAQMNASFTALSSQVRQTLSEASEQQKERLDTVTKTTNDLIEKQERSQEALRLVVEGKLDAIRVENSAKLDEMRKTVDERLQTTLEARLSESFNSVVEQLERVHKGIGEMQSLATNVGDLKNVLTNVKVRGTFGEVQLSLLLDQFLSPEQYVKDAKVKEGSGERVEYAIKFPGRDGEEVLMPVDAKFPREDYEKLVEASDKGDTALVTLFRKQLDTRIKACAKDIRDKYLNPPRTTEWGILFLPTESLYAEVLRQPGLFEHLQREYRVTLAGPTTFAALLNAFQMGFRSLALGQRSSEVWQLLAAVQNEFGKYNSVVENLSKQLNRAANSVDSLGKRTRVMSKKLKGIESLPSNVDPQQLLGIGADDLIAEDDEEGNSLVEGENNDSPTPF